MDEAMLKSVAERVASQLQSEFSDEKTDQEATIYRDFATTPDGKRIGVRVRTHGGQSVDFTVIVTNSESVFRTTFRNAIRAAKGQRPKLLTTPEVLKEAEKARVGGENGYPTWEADIPDEGIRASLVVMQSGEEPFYFSIDVPARDVCFDKYYRRIGGVRQAIDWRLSPGQIANLHWLRTK